jgi:hypothetical protein
MNLVELVLTACLAANGANCRQERLYFENPGSLMQCMFMAQPQIAQWSVGHPHLRVTRWRCQFPEKSQAI